jgi:hypothetical protein
MALLDKQNRGTLLGIGIGAGVVLAFRHVAPVVTSVARPVAKALILGSMTGFEKAAAGLASAAEAFQDLVAEVRADRKLAASAAASGVQGADGSSSGPGPSKSSEVN